jgi:hypothetical protein
MTAVEGLDFAWTKPSPAQVKAAGGHWIAGYFSTDASKNLNHFNIPGYLSAGIPVVTVWETTTGRATQGHQAGVDDAHAAEAERIAAGLPATHVHHFAVDEDTSWSSVVAYFDGAISVLGLDRVGCYGGYPVIVGAHGHGIRYLWQTVAWSGGQWASFATIRQPGGMLLGGSADIDFSEAPDFGQTPRPTTPVPPAPPEDDFMALFKDVNEFKAAVTAASVAALQSQPGRDAGAYANLWWLDHALSGTVPAGANAGQKGLIEDIHKLAMQLAQTPPVVAPAKP